MSEEIILRSNLFIVTKIKKTTRARFWKDLREQHVIRFWYTLENPGHGANGLYATDVKVTCGRREVVDSPTNIAKRLEHFELEEVVT